MGDKKDDFTLLEDLGEFLHKDDTDVDRKLGLKKDVEQHDDFDTEYKSEEETSPLDEFNGEERPEEKDGANDGDPFSSSLNFESGPFSKSSSLSNPESIEDPFVDSDEPPPEFSSESPFSNDENNATAEDSPVTDFESNGSSDFSMGDFPSSFGESASSDSNLDSSPDFSADLPEEDPTSGISNKNDSFKAEVEREERGGNGFNNNNDEDDANSDGHLNFSTSNLSVNDEDQGILHGGNENVDNDDTPADVNLSNIGSSVSQSPPSSSPKTESFQDLKEFAQHISYGKIGQGGNPPFSLILKNIKYKDDAEDILIILREHGLIQENNEEILRNSLFNGSLLLSQLSEFSAVFLVHKFRRFDLDILMGLSEEVFTSKSYSNSRGLVDKRAFKQNKIESINLDETVHNVESILLSTGYQLDGRQIVKYLGIVSSHKIVEEDELLLEETLHSTGPENPEGDGKEFSRFDHDNRHSSSEVDLKKYSPTLTLLYRNLAEGLRPKALMLKGNAIVGINFQLTPILPSKERLFKAHYQLTCTGNVVWVV